MVYRLYRPGDAERLLVLHEAMKIEAALPLPEQDPCTILGVVGCNGNGRPDVALFFRLTTEACMVVNPEMENQAQAIKGLIDPARVGLELKDRDLRMMRLGAIEDVHASVPLAKPKMFEFMPLLGFKPCFDGFRWFFRPISNGER